MIIRCDESIKPNGKQMGTAECRDERAITYGEPNSMIGYRK